MDPVEEIFNETEKHMRTTIQLAEEELATVRTGRASAALLDSIKVDYYGTMVPLKQAAAIAVPDTRLITIQPWEKSMVTEIVKAIQSSALGLNPQSDGNFIRIPLPPLTQERRVELVKAVRHMIENARIAVRNVRREANDKLKKLEREHAISEDEYHRCHKEIQEMTDESIVELDRVCEKKETEIMEI